MGSNNTGPRERGRKAPENVPLDSPWEGCGDTGRKIQWPGEKIKEKWFIIVFFVWMKELILGQHVFWLEYESDGDWGCIWMAKSDLSLPGESCLNPPTFPWKGEKNKSYIEHNCLDLIEYRTEVRAYLEDVPLGKVEVFFYRWILKKGVGEEVQWICNCWWKD